LVGCVHAELGEGLYVEVRVDNFESFFANAIARDAAFGELIGEDKPESSVVRVSGVVGGG